MAPRRPYPNRSTATDMHLDEIDDTLRRLQAAADAIGANLLELERDPNRKLLESATLSGETATLWADAAAALANMWQWFTQLTALLERAKGVRGPRARISADREAELTALLTGPSIELTSADVPLGQRPLLGDPQTTTRCAPDELLITMSEQFERASEVVVAAGAAWDALVPRLRDARSALADTTAAGADLGEDADPDLGRLQARLDMLGEAVTTDPVSVNAADFDALEGDLSSLRAGFDDASRLRDEIIERTERARSMMNELRSATRAAAEAHREVLVKIASPQVPEPLAVDRNLGDELDQVVTLGEKGHWRAAQKALAEWTNRADELLQVAHQTATANRAPIEARNELRGRLDAYHAMAHGTGRLEDPDAAGRYERAYDVLYTAPTDLTEAAELVRSYQDALSRRHEHRKDPR